MIIEATATAATVEEAKEAAMQELGVGDDAEVDFEIISLPQKKTLGLFGGSLAKVRVFMEVADEVKAPAEKKPEKQDKSKKNKTPEKSATKAAEKQQEKPADKKPERAAEKKPSKPVGTLTDEQKEQLVQYLVSVLENMGVENIKTEIIPTDDGIMINIDAARLGVAIGRKGETIDALQHLMSLSANKGKDDYVRVTLNPGGYREKREQTLVGVANKSAQQALRTNRNIMLEPMNSYERRIIHNVVQEVEGVESWSIGENEHRRVCIGTSRDNKPLNPRGDRNRDNFRGGRRDGFRGDRDRGDRGGRRERFERPDYSVKAERTREPIKDGEGLPLYGVITKPKQDKE